MHVVSESGGEALSVRDLFIASIVLITTLPTVFLILRCVSSVSHSKKLYLDDYLTFAGLVVLSAFFALTYRSFNLYDGFDPSSATPEETLSWLVLLQQLGTANIVFASATTWFTKAPILFLYIRLFGVKRWLRLTAHITLVLSAIVLIITTAYAASRCDPKGSWTPQLSANCNTAGSTTGVAIGILGLIMDLIIFILPLPIISRLHLPWAKKIGLCIVFATGLLAVIASIVGVYFRIGTLSGLAANRQISIFLTVVESCITLTVGCVPAAYNVWGHIIIQTTAYKKIHSVVSKISVSSSHASSHSTSFRERGGTDYTHDITPITYIRMGTPKKSHDASLSRVVTSEENPH
ncbi:hypothetical protein F4803DRAFT_544022 [Xylaria telfairii]|nr:hypothetical protein F4803DRAFT_544022 [Xylaria telfairii]